MKQSGNGVPNNLKKRFSNKLFKLLDYLRSEWGNPVADKFIIKIKQRLKNLAQYPFIGVHQL